MARYELTIDPNYVPHWSIFDALRELFQNALDESSLCPTNSMEVIRDGETLKICTKNASLSKATLLIGNSSKRDDSSTIGQEGEGYKLASLVLLRLGHNILIHNYSEKELWTPKIINSRRFGSKLLVVDTEKYLWNSPPNYDLTFEVDGITDEIYEELQTKVLQLRDDEPELIQTDIGQILTGENEVGRIYVNGLFVTTIEEGYKYGYNLLPKDINLDRDRRAVNNFDLSWQTSKMWAKIENQNLVNDLIDKGYADVRYLHSTLNYGDDLRVRDNTFNKFQDEHGENAVPVVDQEEMEYVQSKYSNATPIIVNTAKHELITNSPAYEERDHSLEESDEDDDKSPFDILTEFEENFSGDFSTLTADRFQTILKLSEDWN